MKKMLLALGALFYMQQMYAGTVSGIIREKNGHVLPFSSVLVKGTTTGVSANARGFYTMQLQPGDYILICQYIGYRSAEKKIRVDKTAQQVDFELENQQYQLKEVMVKSGGEDPAYAIIRNAIGKRALHRDEIKKFQAEVYLKGQLQLRDYPKRFFGQKIDFEDGDSGKQKMLFLSETVARYSVEPPGKQKIEVLSTRVSGRSDAFGFSNPQVISFYENTVQLGSGLNPRGFISPIAHNALHYYRYQFEGSFYENGKEINRIKVLPRRKYEPLFAGYIHIIEDDWHIQSLRLHLLREQQMQLLDTLVVEQLYVPAGNYWVIKNQVIYPSGKFFGFDFFGSFVQVYDQFDLVPNFRKKFFDNTLIKFYDSSNKKPMAYWDSIRPLPLLDEEARDYKKKDSLEQLRKSPAYMDSIDRKRNRITPGGLLFTGQSFSKQRKKQNISFESLLSSLNYNTVEGAVVNFSPVYSRSFEGRRSMRISPYARYGFANKHLNVHVDGRYQFGRKYFNSISFSGGRRVFQFNNAQPITPRINTLSTLLYEHNHMKIYEADYFRMGYTAGIGSGIILHTSFQFQNRYALQNLADMTSWKDIPDRSFTPNYPVDITPAAMPHNRSSTITVEATWRPGSKYIELPDRKIGIGSDYPTLDLTIVKGIPGLLGSDADFTKWQAGIADDIGLKLGGNFQYRITAGGFLHAGRVTIPDYQHFTGNQTILASDHMTSFQLAPYYKYSNTARFYATARAEYHFNGLLSNKIPGFKKLNWFFVTGGGLLHIGNGANYYETNFGIENILKIIRVDFVQGFEKGGGRPSGFRISLPFFLEGRRGDL